MNTVHIVFYKRCFNYYLQDAGRSEGQYSAIIKSRDPRSVSHQREYSCLLYIYIYIYIFVCVCVCRSKPVNKLAFNHFQLHCPDISFFIKFWCTFIFFYYAG